MCFEGRIIVLELFRPILLLLSPYQSYCHKIISLANILEKAFNPANRRFDLLDVNVTPEPNSKSTEVWHKAETVNFLGHCLCSR